MNRVMQAARIFLAALSCAPAIACAGNFVVTPVRVDLSPVQSSAVLTLTNAEDSDLTVQVRATRWTQKDGQDQYAATRELIASPSVFKLAPHAIQVVRIGLRVAPDAANETAYRLFLEEVPGAPAPGETGVRVALRMGIPVFVASAAAQQPRLEWSAVRDGGRLVINLRNGGNMHARLVNAAMTRGARPLGDPLPLVYLLAGQQRSWSFDTAAGSESVRIQAQSDEGNVDLQLPVADR